MGPTASKTLSNGRQMPLSPQISRPQPRSTAAVVTRLRSPRRTMKRFGPAQLPAPPAELAIGGKPARRSGIRRHKITSDLDLRCRARRHRRTLISVFHNIDDRHHPNNRPLPSRNRVLQPGWPLPSRMGITGRGARPLTQWLILLWKSNSRNQEALHATLRMSAAAYFGEQLPSQRGVSVEARASLHAGTTRFHLGPGTTPPFPNRARTHGRRF